MPKPPVTLDLRWTGDLAFEASASRDRRVVTDGNGHSGFSPVELLAVATAGCMAVDLVHILTRSRQEVKALRAWFAGDRAEHEPHRLIAVRLEFELEGRIAQAQLDRAVQLSRDKYCSVWNSLRGDVTLDIVTRIRAVPPS